MKVIVDADACPKNVLLIIQRYASDYNYEVVTVASFNHNIQNENHIITDNASQAADTVIFNETREGDIAVTQDFGLAAMVLAKKAYALSPRGKIFKESKINSILEERALLAKYRRGGGRTKGPSKHTKKDDENFTLSFLEILKIRKTEKTLR